MTQSKTRSLLAAVLLASTACSTVRPVTQPAQFFSRSQPDMVVVTYTDNSQVPVAAPKLNGDTLVGTWAGLGEPVAVPLSEVRQIDARQSAPRRTAVMVTMLAFATGFGIWGFTQLSREGGRVCDYTAGAPQDNCVGEGFDGPGPDVNK